MAFGYASKIYNDKKTAVYVDNGTYMIPLKSDKRHQNIRIDRFDIRHLIDNDANPLWNEISVNSEIEYLLQIERYRDLEYHELYKDEDYTELDSTNKKRRNTAIPYHYEQTTTKIEKEISSKYKTPPSMIVPKSMEHVQIIQDVANQINSAKQDSNLVEIRIQVKNSRNQLYSFLNRQDVLYSFYKHVCWISNSGLANYDSSSSSSSSDEENQGQDEEIPSKEIQTIIEKTAFFIAKSNNSDDLEQHIRTRKSQDISFDFLKPNHKYYKYFKSRVVENK